MNYISPFIHPIRTCELSTEKVVSVAVTPNTPILPSSISMELPTASGKLHKDYTVYEDVKSILPIYIHVYPVRPCRDDLCEIIPSIWGAVARYDRSDLFIIACGQSHLFMNMLWSAMISCELSYHVAAVLPVSCGDNFPHKSLVLNLSSKGHGYHTCIWDKVILGRRLKGYTSNWRFGWY